YVSTDLFENQGTHYLVVVDHYSGYLEINEYEKEITSEQTVQKLKKLFATHGIPQIVYSDNGPQYDVKEFKDFSQIWGFKHQTFSARYPQANGLAERAVQTAKRLVIKSLKEKSDLHLVLLVYRNTPKDAKIGSPVQRCMSRRTRTRLPTNEKLLIPQVINSDKVTSEIDIQKQKSKSRYDQNSKPLPPLDLEKCVRYRHENKWMPAQLLGQAEKPRRYILQTPAGRMICRNRRHLLQTNEDDVYHSARQRYFKRKSQDDLIAEESVPENVPNIPKTPPRQNMFQSWSPRASHICESPQLKQSITHAKNKNQMQNIAPAQKSEIVTRTGRISKAPTKLRDFVM
ncbi:uncharacterized protein LOC143225842, partial [Tachypleus tridentatus]|uniref:uncharacterized protein LOC143225842 n=1 Tax=Tachypleus tridentatus TaxID=6853 RepID=UPI003FD5348C